MIAVETLAPYLGGVLAASGVVVAASRRREFILRWSIWATVVPLVTAAFWWGEPGIALVAVIAGTIAAWEYGALVRLPAVDRALLFSSVAAVVLVVWREPDLVLRTAGVAALVLTATPLLAGDVENGARRASASLLGLAWLSLLAGMVTLGSGALAIFIAVSVADIVAYFAGPGLGGPKLSPLSPAKRWSGTLAGSIVAISCLAALSALSWQYALAVAVGGPLGDLVESMIKRGARTKDSGRLLAGSGGLLDRIDSLLIALAIALVLS